MYAYLVPGQNADSVLDDPRMARLQQACHRWTRTGTADGVLLTLPGRPTSRSEYGEAIETSDGMLFLPPVQGILYDLARSDVPLAIDVELPEITVSVAVAAASPRRIQVMPGGKASFGDYCDDFAALAENLYYRASTAKLALDRQETPVDIVTDEEAAWMIFLAVRKCYHITEEAWNHLSPITSADIGPLCSAVWGTAPKSVAGDADTSPSSPPASSPTPNSPPANSTT